MAFLTQKTIIIDNLKTLVESSVQASTKNQSHVQLAFSGGLDSGILAKLLSNLKKKFTLYTVCTPNSRDHKNSTALANQMGWNLKLISVNSSQIEKYIKLSYSVLAKNKIPLNPLFLSINSIFLALASLISHGRQKILMIGTGADSIFGGFAKHSLYGKDFAANNLQTRLKESLAHAIKEEAHAQDIIAKHYGVKMLRPFLNKKLVSYAMKIPPNLKINKHGNKIILREVALQIGLPKKFVNIKKAAAQYSSGFDRTLGLIAKRKGFRYKHEYLNYLKNTAPLH